jgi:hypothetical protein
MVDWLVGWLVGWLVYSCCSHLEQRTSVKHFVSLQFLNLRHSARLLGRVISPSHGRYLTQTQNTHRHPCLEWDSNPRSQRSSERTVHVLDRAATVLGERKYTREQNPSREKNKKKIYLCWTNIVNFLWIFWYKILTKKKWGGFLFSDFRGFV